MTQTFEFITDAMHVAKREAVKYFGREKFMVLATTDDYRTTQFEVSIFSHELRNAAIASGRRLVDVVGGV